MLQLCDIARLEELRQAQGLREVAQEARPFAGGTMARAEPGSWSNTCVGAGFDGPVDPAEFDSFIRFFEERHLEPRLEVAPFADPSLFKLLEAHRFSVRQWENVFFRELDPASVPIAPVTLPQEYLIELIDPRDPAACEAFVRTSSAGFHPPGSPLPEASLELSRRCVAHPRTRAVVARPRSAGPYEFVGAGYVELAGPIAGLFGTSVLPEHRARGVQQNLLAFRLTLAAQHGCTLATIGSMPGIATERNVRRLGFQLAYTKAACARAGEGLAANL